MALGTRPLECFTRSPHFLSPPKWPCSESHPKPSNATGASSRPAGASTTEKRKVEDENKILHCDLELVAVVFFKLDEIKITNVKGAPTNLFFNEKKIASKL